MKKIGIGASIAAVTYGAAYGLSYLLGLPKPDVNTLLLSVILAGLIMRE